ncbi:MAG: PAS domain-containing protein [Actinobacteria bacterium]|nr:PAS domain-containing protein [Actinomycetota bacterium]
MDRREPDLDRILHTTLLGDAVQNARLAVLLADERGHYIAANDKACVLTGYDRHELLHFRAGELAADEPSRRIYENFLAGRKLQGRKAVRCRDGNVVDCRYWAVATVVGQLPYYMLMLWAARRRLVTPTATA